LSRRSPTRKTPLKERFHPRVGPPPEPSDALINRQQRRIPRDLHLQTVNARIIGKFPVPWSDEYFAGTRDSAVVLRRLISNREEALSANMIGVV
jgi:hypothetical protein